MVPLFPVSQITSRPGALSAICEEIEITVHGKGGHGAQPHQTIDPIAIGTELINRIYKETSRQVNQPEPAVISFGVFQAGINSNVIPDSAKISGTLRTVSEDTSVEIKTRIQDMVTDIEKATGARIEIERKYHLPSVYNDPTLYETWTSLAADLLGQDQIIQLESPSMGGEDFACYLQHTPGCMLRLGVGIPGRDLQVLHSSCFDINEASLVLGTQLLAIYSLFTTNQ